MEIPLKAVKETMQRDRKNPKPEKVKCARVACSKRLLLGHSV